MPLALCLLFHLELQATFASAVGQRFNAAMVQVSTAVEYYGVDTGCFGTFSDQLAYCY